MTSKTNFLIIRKVSYDKKLKITRMDNKISNFLAVSTSNQSESKADLCAR